MPSSRAGRAWLRSTLARWMVVLGFTPEFIKTLTYPGADIPLMVGIALGVLAVLWALVWGLAFAFTRAEVGIPVSK